MLNLRIIGSTRPGRAADWVVPWITTMSREHGAFDVEVLDLQDWQLPLFGETLAAVGDPKNPAFSTPPVDLRPGRTRYDRSTPRPPRPPTRRDRVTAIITSHPPREWSGHDLAILLGVKPRNMLTQLGEWARLGFFTRTGFGTYRLNTPPSDTPSTNPPDP